MSLEYNGEAFQNINAVIEKYQSIPDDFGIHPIKYDFDVFPYNGIQALKISVRAFMKVFTLILFNKKNFSRLI